MGVGGGLPWTNTVTGAAGGYSGGSRPAYNPDTGNIIFGYTTQTVSQTVGIASALAGTGAGVQLSGYRYQWQINNDLQNSGGNRGTLTGNVSLKGSAGNVLESFDYNYNQNYPGFTVFSGTQFFNNRYDTATASSITLSFTGKDQNYWAGYYGPRVNLDNFSLLYTVDPCKSNPAYSPTCSGFSNIVTSGNLSPDPNISANSLTQVVAINTALKSAGFGATVHGFNYKFDYNVGQGFFGCTATNQDGSCSWYMSTPAYVSASASMTNSSNQTLISRNHSFTNEGTSGTVNSQLLLSSSMNQVSLGNIRLSGGSSGVGSSIGNYSMSLIYTPDPCVKNPLYSPNCSGFAQAIAAKLSASNTTSAPILESVTSIAPIVATVNAAQPNNNTPSKPQTETPKGGPQSKNVSTALSIIAKNQQREQAIQNSAVQTAIAEAAAAGDKAQQQAVSVAAAAVTMSQTLSNTSVQTQRQSNTATASTTVSQAQSGPSISNTPIINENKSVTVTTTVQAPAPRASTHVSTSVSSATSTANDSQYSMISAAQSYFNRAQATQSVQTTITSSLPPQPNKSANITVATVVTPTIATSSAPVFSQSSTDQQSNMTFAYVQSQNTMFYAMAATPVEQQQQPTVQPVSFARQAEIEQVNNSVGFLTNRTDPLNEVVESKPVVTSTTTAESTQTVKSKVDNNELAGGVDINKMALTPVGYSNYTNLMLKDGKMYEPKEIYKNQTPVDNARALRQLSTDRLHQQMIEQQYRR